MEQNELKEFRIEDQKMEGFNISASTDEIEQFDFSSDKPFDIDANHELLSFIKKQEETDEEKELIKLQEAKNIIEKNAKTFLDPMFVENYAKEEQNLINLIKKFEPNLESVKSMTEDKKNKIYEIAQHLFNNFQKKLNDLNFNFPLTNDEVKFVFKVFRDKLEYDQNEVFQLKELKENYLDKEFEKQENGEFLTFINVNDLIIFYHLFSKYKVKGITQEHYNFLQVLTKIGERIKLFNAYNVIVQRLSTDFQFWGSALSVDGDVVDGKVMEPKIMNDVTSSKPLDVISVIDNETSEVIK